MEHDITHTHASQFVDIYRMTPYNLVDDYHYFFAWRGEVPAPFPEQTTSHNLDFRKNYIQMYTNKIQKGSTE